MAWAQRARHRRRRLRPSSDAPHLPSVGRSGPSKCRQAAGKIRRQRRPLVAFCQLR
jgi:hypothetical protein